MLKLVYDIGSRLELEINKNSKNSVVFQSSVWRNDLKTSPSPYESAFVTTESVFPSVTRKKSPNVYKSCPKMISLEK